MEAQRDEKLWQLAKRRADFQDSFIGSATISVTSRAIWYFTAGLHG